MIQSITPDLPFQSSLKRVFTETIIGALVFPAGFILGKYILQIRKNNVAEPLPVQEGFINFFSRNIFYFLAGILFLFIIRFWYSLNKIKRIREIHYNTQTGLITIEYKNLLGNALRKTMIRKENLRFHLNTSKREAAISNKLTESFILNIRTGFSMERLMELQHLIVKEVEYI